MIDGVGIFMLLEELFAKAAEFYKMRPVWDYPLPEDDDLSKRLSPALRVAANIPESLSPDLQNYFNKHNEANTRMHSIGYSGALALKSFITNTDRFRRIAITAPRTFSTRILDTISGSGFGFRLPHLFIAALAKALAEHQFRGKDRRLAYYFHRPMIDLRSDIFPDGTSSENAAGLYSAFGTQTLTLSLTIPKQGDSQQSYLNEIERLADQVQEHETAADKEFQELIEKHSGANPEAMVAPWNFKALHPPPDFDPSQEIQFPSPVAPVSLSRVGPIEPRFHTDDDFFEIPTVWTASQPIKDGIAAYLSIWKGEIELSAVFNTRFHDETFMEGFLHGTFEHVFRGVGMSGYTLNVTRVKDPMMDDL
ncbi:uncharacterized protein B0J16DRAFT_401767 [Fusarium flagelliforme]|nr:uncharacterized protein B0J16DRAFT_401767 [Fusarium flagelliforme]KAH7183431.1 hypothetical protein B0J16DRAFT_401767 [Fusarium flagelliforme]